MPRLLTITAIFAACSWASSQQIYDVWETTSDKTKLFSYSQPSNSVTFGTSDGTSGDIVVDDSEIHQTVYGFGGSMTDSSALVLSNLKSTNPQAYQELLHKLFSAKDGDDAAGLSYVRVPLGASDFSANGYTYDDKSGDKTLDSFDVSNAPSYVFDVLKDVQDINSLMKFHVVAWSPPAWMKDSKTLNGGALSAYMENTYANYLMKAVQGFKEKGINIYAIFIQNEPENTNPTYPTSKFTAPSEGRVGKILRGLMDSNGLANDMGPRCGLSGYAGDSYAGVAFHCYMGDATQQDSFNSQYPDKAGNEIYVTECSGTIGSDFWKDLQWYMNNLFIGAVNHNAAAVLMWNLALDGNGKPLLPKTSSCAQGCRGIVTVNSDGTYDLNQEFYAMGQASKAIIPKDPGGPSGKRIGVKVGAKLTVGVYVTGRVVESDQPRYSLVVLNSNGNPTDATIEFRPKQVKYMFPVGVTTLWWYAPADGSTNTTSSDTESPTGTNTTSSETESPTGTNLTTPEPDSSDTSSTSQGPISGSNNSISPDPVSSNSTESAMRSSLEAVFADPVFDELEEPDNEDDLEDCEEWEDVYEQ